MQRLFIKSILGYMTESAARDCNFSQYLQARPSTGSTPFSMISLFAFNQHCESALPHRVVGALSRTGFCLVSFSDVYCWVSKIFPLSYNAFRARWCFWNGFFEIADGNQTVTVLDEKLKVLLSASYCVFTIILYVGCISQCCNVVILSFFFISNK